MRQDLRRFAAGRLIAAEDNFGGPLDDLHHVRRPPQRCSRHDNAVVYHQHYPFGSERFGNQLGQLTRAWHGIGDALDIAEEGRFGRNRQEGQAAVRQYCGVGGMGMDDRVGIRFLDQRLGVERPFR